MTSSTTDSATSLRELTKLTIYNVVDNETDGLSSPCQCCADGSVATYTDNLALVVGQGNGEVADFQRLCVAAHGLSLLLIAEYVDPNDGSTKVEHLLMDAGPVPSVWSQNAKNLRLDLNKINTFVLSHYHMDHFGGLDAVVTEIAKAKKVSSSSVGSDTNEKLVVDFSAPMIFERGIKHPVTGKIAKMLPDTPTVQQIQEWGGQVQFHEESHTAGKNCFYVSGIIPRVTPYETGIPNHCTKVNGEFVLDPEILDERYVAVKIKGRGIIVFSSCSHAGIVNVCKDVTAKLNSRLVAVVGGFHLVGRNTEDRTVSTIQGLKELNPDLILAGHCTGWKAKAKFAAEFEYNFQVLSVGGRYVFNSI